jgi:hypothetical protein
MRRAIENWFGEQIAEHALDAAMARDVVIKAMRG